ncbi:IS110 family transposase [Cytobacillus luteolus]|uniref:IS110 family transposase n=1 Tax=Litchfieldia luteola TaxID=682179 RepID=UPI0029CA7E3A|nr:transposase [Cytobacillus luteolus]
MEFLVINAQHIKAVPGRKTDVNDAEWIAKLLHHGLITASYIPDRNKRELRELVRYRRSIIQERARQQNRIQKVLEGANNLAQLYHKSKVFPLWQCLGQLPTVRMIL